MAIVYTVSNLVDDTLTHLAGTAADELNLVNDALSIQAVNYVDTVTFTYELGGCVPGCLLSIDDEIMYVLSTNESVSPQTAAVLRGQKGSTPAAHLAAAIIMVDPPWPRYSVMEVLRDEIRSWGPQVFSVVTKSITIQAGISGYDLGDPSPVFERVRVFRDPPNFIGTNGIPWSGAGLPDDQSWPSIPAEIRRDQSTTAFPSGNALILKTNSLGTPSTVWVVYSKPFDVDTSWTDTTDCIADIGMDTSDLDIVPLGAAWRLLAFRQPRRMLTTIAGQPRDAQEIPPLAIMQSALQFKEQRDSRLNDAEIRLLNRFPIEISIS